MEMRAQFKNKLHLVIMPAFMIAPDVKAELSQVEHHNSKVQGIMY